MSTIIRVRCIDQVLTFESTPTIASGGLEEDFIQVDFCSKWDGLTRTAVFWQSEKEAYHVKLDETDSCAIPREILADEGVIYFGLFGVSAAGRQRTSEVMRYTIVKGAITSGTKPTDPTPDIYTQLLAKYKDMVDIAADTRAKEQAFEQAMTAQQNAFEQALNKDQAAYQATMTENQEAFEEELNAAQEAYEKKVLQMIADGLVPDDSITTVKLKNGAVTAEKIAPGVLIDSFTRAETLTAATAAMFGLGEGAVPNDIFSILSARAKIETGTYAGAGKYGADNPNQLTIGENAKMVIVMGASANGQISYAFNGTWIIGGNWMHVETTSGNTSGNSFCKATYQDGVISWYDTDKATDQLNSASITYAYIVVSYG